VIVKLTELNPNAQSLLEAAGVDEWDFKAMCLTGEFVEMPEGFIWLVDNGGKYRLMAESVKRPWSLGFVKRLRKIQKACDKPVYVESDDPTTIELCRKAGAMVINSKRAEWGNV
jgi:hypothetical protein